METAFSLAMKEMGETIEKANLESNAVRKYMNSLMFNVRDFGAIGDGQQDDILAIQQAVNECHKQGGVVFFPYGDYRITSPIILPGNTSVNVTIAGVGSGTKILSDLSDDEFAITQLSGTTIGGLIIKDLDFSPFQNNYNSGAINISKVIRGVSLYNLRSFNLKYGYKIFGEIWSVVNFYDCKAYLPLEFNESVGFNLHGNTIHCNGCESIGFETCLNWGGTVGSWTGGSLAGSPGFLTKNAIVINASFVKFKNVWFEQVDSLKEIIVINGGTVDIDTCFIAEGDVIVNAGTLRIASTRLNTDSGSIKHGENAIVEIGDAVTRFAGNIPIFPTSGDYAKGKVTQKLNFDDKFISNQKGIIENPSLKSGRALPFYANNAAATISDYPTEFISGDRSVRVTTTAGFTGIRFSLTNVIPNRKYTVVARVKVLTGEMNIYATQTPSTTTNGSSSHPVKVHSGTGWGVIHLTLYSSDTNLEGRIISNAAGSFLIDSINVFEGVDVRNPEQSFVSSDQLYLQGRKIESRTSAPTTGNWLAGDFIINSAPTNGGVWGWVCVTAGSPGTWQSLGVVGAVKLTTQSDSVATDIATLKTDFNALLSKLRSAGLM